MTEGQDPVAAAMAKAMGTKLVDDDAAGSTDLDGQDDKGSGVDDNADDKGAAGADDKGADDKPADDKPDDTPSGGQDDDKGSGADQTKDAKIIPDTGTPGDGTDQTVSFDQTLSERSGGRFKSMADIDKALEEAPSTAFANEQVAKLNEYVKGGGNLADFVRTQTVDYSQMNPIDLVREARMLESADLTAEEVSLLIEEDFGVAEDASDRAKTIAGAKLKQEAAQALAKLNEHKQKWATPPAAKTAETREADIAAWETQLNGAVDGVEEITVALNQTDNFSFKLEPEAKAKIKSDNRELDKFFSRYVKADGTEDTERFVKDMAILDNYEAIIRAAASTQKSAGKDEVIKDIKNTDFEGKDKKSGEEAPLTIAQQAAKHVFGR